jgi:hypothetical protein
LFGKLPDRFGPTQQLLPGSNDGEARRQMQWWCDSEAVVRRDGSERRRCGSGEAVVRRDGSERRRCGSGEAVVSRCRERRRQRRARELHSDTRKHAHARTHLQVHQQQSRMPASIEVTRKLVVCTRTRTRTHTDAYVRTYARARAHVRTYAHARARRREDARTHAREHRRTHKKFLASFSIRQWQEEGTSWSWWKWYPKVLGLNPTVEMVGFEPRTLGYRALRCDKCARCPVTDANTCRRRHGYACAARTHQP